jgi:hypothetical protein
MISASNRAHDFDFARDPVTGSLVTLPSQAVALIGGSATGKSVLMRRFARQYALNGGGFIVLDPNATSGDTRERYLGIMREAGREREFSTIDFNSREAVQEIFQNTERDGFPFLNSVKLRVRLREILEHNSCMLVCLPAVHPPALNQALCGVIFDALAASLKERAALGENDVPFFVGLDDPFPPYAAKYAAEDLGKVPGAAEEAGVGLVLASQAADRLTESFRTTVVLGPVRDRDIDDVWALLAHSADDAIAACDIPNVLRSLKVREALVAEAHSLKRVGIPVWTPN